LAFEIRCHHWDPVVKISGHPGDNMDKVIVRHGAALRAKYGSKGLARVDAALKALVKADARRGIDSTVLDIDRAGAMKPYGPPVPAGNPRALKAAIDAVAAKEKPHYILLLGAPDVLPLVPLVNPAHQGDGGDSDRLAPSDLPYACDAPYSTDANKFLGPTRVVGRLPDLPGARTPDLLLRLLKAAARAKSMPREAFQESFSLSAEPWVASTRLSVTNTFGSTAALQVCPPGGPGWTRKELSPRMHFINCHGGDQDPRYFGQHGEDFPVAHEAKRIAGKVTDGTVVAAECCYGAQLYDPAKAGGQTCISLTYLADGALGFFGSTTIAYGPSEGNGSADLICQYFLQRVLAGSSLGRAALEARQKFAGERTHLDPFDLKTLAQFYLLGDPSLQPVAFAAHALTRGRTFKQAFAKVQDRGVRNLRRERLEREGAHLGKVLPAVRPSDGRPSEPVARALSAMAKESGLRGGLVARSYGIVDKAHRRSIHVLSGFKVEERDGAPVQRLVALVATEDQGELLHVRRLHSR
jgi:hypothetical protein